MNLTCPTGQVAAKVNVMPWPYFPGRRLVGVRVVPRLAPSL